MNPIEDMMLNVLIFGYLFIGLITLVNTWYVVKPDGAIIGIAAILASVFWPISMIVGTFIQLGKRV